MSNHFQAAEELLEGMENYAAGRLSSNEAKLVRNLGPDLVLAMAAVHAQLALVERTSRGL